VTHFVTLLASAASSALISAIWQGALLAVCAALCLRLLPSLSAATRSLLWTAVFAIIIALHFVPSPQAAGPTHALNAAPIWSVLLAILWLTLSLFRAGQFAVSAQRLRQIVRRATPVSAESFCAPFIAPLSQAMSGSISNSRKYTLCISPDVDRPSVLGFFHPRILLPVGLLETLTPAELHQVLLHETEHLRRSDDWTNLLQKFALVLFPLNPALLWVERRLCLERELACDDRVLAVAGSRKTYATCLTQLAEHSILHRGIALALGTLGDRHRQSELATRVHRILRRPETPLSPAKARFAAASIVLTLAAATFTVARIPRLITFTPGIDGQLAAATQPANPHLPADVWDSRTSKPTLVKAVMPSPAHAIKATRLRTFSHRPQPGVSKGAVVRGLDVSSSATRRNSLNTPRALTVTYRFEQFQYIPAVAYAAVATPDGWIIIQL